MNDSIILSYDLFILYVPKTKLTRTPSVTCLSLFHSYYSPSYLNVQCIDSSRLVQLLPEGHLLPERNLLSHESVNNYIINKREVSQ